MIVIVLQILHSNDFIDQLCIHVVRLNSCIHLSAFYYMIFEKSVYSWTLTGHIHEIRNGNPFVTWLCFVGHIWIFIMCISSFLVSNLRIWRVREKDSTIETKKHRDIIESIFPNSNPTTSNLLLVVCFFHYDNQEKCWTLCAQNLADIKMISYSGVQTWSIAIASFFLLYP